MAGNIVVIIAALGVALAQDYIDERFKYLVDTTHWKDVPTHFEASGPEALSTITKYVSDITKTAEMTNSVATFNVQVAMERKHKTKHGHIKPTKPKKFKVPLKKKNLRLSSFEMDIRRYVNEHKEKNTDEDDSKNNKEFNMTSEKNLVIPMIKKNRVSKYKPYLTGVKPKYHKMVKPVRNKEIVLN